MAIPCLVNVVAPSRDEENLRRLERILCELFLVLRALLTHPTQPNNNNHHYRAPGRGGGPPPPPPQGGSGPGTEHNSGISRLYFLSGSTLSSTNGRARNSTPSQSTSKGGKSRASWQQLGCELRHIADNLNSKRQTPTIKVSSVKQTSSTFSLAMSVCRLILGGGGDAG